MQSNKKVLIVEDERNVRNAIKRIVNQGLPSVEVLETGNGKQALSIAKNNKPNLILLDILMSSMNGLQVLKVLKESENLQIKRIPVIMLTGVSNREINEKARKIGAVDYITKPFNEKIFLMKIKNYLK